MGNIAPSTLMLTEQAAITKCFQQIIEELNCLSIFTRPDITTIVSLLSAHFHSPEPAQHFDSALHIVKYLASNPSYDLSFSSHKSEPIHVFVNFPDDIHSIQAYFNANWGPMDALVPKPIATPREQSPSLQSISGRFFIHTRPPIAWGCVHHTDITQSSCQAETHCINDTTKLIHEFCLFFHDLGLPLTSLVAIKNVNQGAIQQPKGTTTKKIRWVNLCENLVCANISNQNIQEFATVFIPTYLLHGVLLINLH